VSGLAALGFGHIEVGTLTPRPQPGNPRPRVFRLPGDGALINRMGFPNGGAPAAVSRLKALAGKPRDYILGVSLGKQKDTPLEAAADDYVVVMRAVHAYADYLAVNISSPNTPGLRALQSRAALEGLLAPLAAERREQARALGKPVPILVKLAPDLTDEELDAALEAVINAGIDGVIISNTTLRRDGLQSPLAAETGGLSGAPLNARNTALVRSVVQRTGGRLPVVASGGVMNAADAQAKLDAGAALVQLYTGLIYAGPGLVKEILDRGLTV